MAKDIREIWQRDDLLIFTTNGVVKKNGELVMGKGIAKVVRDEYGSNVAFVLGRFVKEQGNYPVVIIYDSNDNKPQTLLSFPTKEHWKDKSSLELIKRSKSVALKRIRFSHKALKERVNRILCPLWGTENGGLTLEEVKPYLEEFKKELEELGFKVVFFAKRGEKLWVGENLDELVGKPERKVEENNFGGLEL